MQFDWWTFAFQLVNVAVLAWLLGRFLFKPVAGIVAERKAAAAKAMQAAEDARRAAADAEKASRAEQERIAAERVGLLEEAREEAEGHRAQLIDKAKADAGAIIERARVEAERVTAEEGERQLRRATELAFAVAERVFADLPGEARIAGYPERLAAAISALGAEERTAILGDVDDLRLAAPRALSEVERATVDAVIGPLVALEGSLPVEVDDALIAGLELRSRHGVIRNSLGSDLKRVAKALVDDEHA